jgi:hypothetical protein
MHFFIFFLTMNSILINVLTNSTGSKNFFTKKFIIKWKEKVRTCKFWLAWKACIAWYVALILPLISCQHSGFLSLFSYRWCIHSSSCTCIYTTCGLLCLSISSLFNSLFRSNDKNRVKNVKIVTKVLVGCN